MKLHLIASLFCISLIQNVLSDAASKEEECEQEEKDVELCAQQFLLYRNNSMPQTGPEMDIFCRENKAKEQCLSKHSKKCLSHSANQAISELIRSMAMQNRVICANKGSRKLYMRTSQCLNRVNESGRCYQKFMENVHGIHQYSQQDKMPIICCSYHKFSNCLQGLVKQCGQDVANAVNRLVKNYAGETLNYVCREYKLSSNCSSQTSGNVLDLSQIKEEIPQSYFSLLVKIYLS